MLAKIIAHDTTREKAIAQLRYALSKLVLLGPVTNIELLKNILSSNSFLRGEYDTNFIIDNKQITQTKRNQSEIQNIVIVATLYRWSKRNLEKKLLKNLPSGWRNNFYAKQTERYFLRGQDIKCEYKTFHAYGNGAISRYIFSQGSAHEAEGQ